MSKSELNKQWDEILKWIDPDVPASFWHEVEKVENGQFRSVIQLRQLKALIKKFGIRPVAGAPPYIFD